VIKVQFPLLLLEWMLCSLMKGALLSCVISQKSMPRKGSDINLDSLC
jgi:hypothetical protein